MGELGAQRTSSLTEIHTAINENASSLASAPCCYPHMQLPLKMVIPPWASVPLFGQQLKEAFLCPQATDQKKISRFAVSSGSSLVGKMGV